MISPLSLFFYTPDKDSLLMGLIVLAFCIWVSLIVIGITWAIVKTVVYLQSKNNNTEKTDNIIVEMVKAKYHKYCPKIDWK
jgi:phosphate starvation-inducible membrane PsiE